MYDDDIAGTRSQIEFVRVFRRVICQFLAEEIQSMQRLGEVGCYCPKFAFGVQRILGVPGDRD